MKRLPRSAVPLAALGVLLLHALIAWGTPVPGGFAKYGAAAESAVEGRLAPERLVDFSPLLLEVAIVIERGAPGRTDRILGGLQIVAIAIAAGALVAWLRRRLPACLTLGALVFFAFDRQILVAERIVEPESLLLGAVTLWLAAQDRRPGLAGIAAAVGIAARPSLLPVALLAPLADRFRRRRWEGRRVVAFLVPIALVLGLLAVRNRAATGAWRAPTMNPGTVFFEGNNPLSRGTSAVYPPSVFELTDTAGDIPDSPHVLYRRVARSQLGADASPTEVNAFWAGRAVDFLRSEPAAAAGLLRAKLLRAFHGFHWHDVPVAWQLEGRMPLPTWPWGLLTALALVGVATEARRWRRSVLPLALFGSQLAVLLVFYVSARQRLVWLPALLYFAGRALVALCGLPARRRLVGGAAWLLLALVLSAPTDEVRAELEFRRGWIEADGLLREIRARVAADPPLARHVDLAVEAAAAAPWWLDRLSRPGLPSEDASFAERVAGRLDRRSGERPEAASVAERFDHARVALEAGRLDRAHELFLAFVESGDRLDRGPWHPSSARWGLARIARLRGDREAARQWLESATRARPGDPWILAERVALDADPESLDRLERWWSRLDADLLVGRAHLAGGDPERAVVRLRSALADFPELGAARSDLAAALAAAGELEAGFRELERVSQDPRIAVRHHETLTALVLAWVEGMPDETSRERAARQLERLGAFASAEELKSGAETPAGGSTRGAD